MHFLLRLVVLELCVEAALAGETTFFYFVEFVAVESNYM